MSRNQTLDLSYSHKITCLGAGRQWVKVPILVHFEWLATVHNDIDIAVVVFVVFAIVLLYEGQGESKHCPLVGISLGMDASPMAFDNFLTY